MPIPVLKVKSPQNWKKKRRYPTDKLIAKRRKAALTKNKIKNIPRDKKQGKFKIAKKSNYFGRRKSGQQLWKHKLTKLIFKIVISGLVVVILIGGGLFVYYSGQVPTREEFIASTEGSTTKIYDRTGEHILYDLSGDQKKTWLPLDQIPEQVKWALIAIEDDQFYSHKGFDLPALIKVGLHEVFGIGAPRGGSTITQQLVKNTLLTPEHTYRRKIKELILSYQLEKKFSKDEILELYLNIISYGSTAHGVEAAAELYFGKSAQELTLTEAATLAAMLRATTYYSPYGNHIDKLLARRNLVLTRMAELGYINKQQAEAAKKIKPKFKRLAQSIQAPHFSLYIKELLAEKYGDEIVEKGGLKVITTLDWHKQQLAEEAIAHGVERNEKRYGAHNAALVSINAKTGEVLAMVGSRDYFNEEYDGAVNVTMRPRQPGSSFKPVVYAAAFEQGLSPKTILFDALTNFKTETGDDYEPHNYDDNEQGPVSIRKALQGSLNIPAVKAIYLAGVNHVLDLAEKMGYTTFADRSRFGLSLVLGGGEVKLVDHVKAFAVFADEGKRHNLQYILKIEDADGKILEEFNPEDNQGEEVMDQQIAREINNVLSDDEARAYVFGTGSSLTLPGRPVAAKTGTTNDYRDGWTIGYTPSMVTGVWVGNNDNTAMKGAAAGGNVAAPIWHEYMKEALADSPVENFNEPEPIELPQKPMLNGEIQGEKIVKIDKATGKLATATTPPEFIVEKKVQELHSILHYVNKNNILGPIPEHPENDEQYLAWEEGVKKWAEENDMNIEETPMDDNSSETGDLNLVINDPHMGTHFNQPELNVKITVKTTHTIDKVEYYLDTQLISVQKNWPYNLNNYRLMGFNNGEHGLRVIAYDSFGNVKDQYIKIYLNLAEEYTQPVTWLSLSNNSQIFAEQLPYELKVKINNYNLYKKVDFYMKPLGSSSTWLGYQEITNDKASILLSDVVAGNYEFYVVLTDKAGKVLQGKSVWVEVVE